MANNVNQLKADIRTAFGANLDLATRTELLANFLVEYPGDWAAFLAAGNADTAANRGIFATNMLHQKYFIEQIWRSGRRRQQVNALPDPGTIE